MPEPVAAVVPARNESARIGATVAALRRLAAVGEVIVVDDASTDDTAEVARAAGARVLRLERNVGKGGALAAGAAQAAAGVLLFVDADLARTASESERLLGPVLAGDADMVVGALPRRDGPSGFGLVEGLARWGIRRLAGAAMDRPLSGQRALRREVLDHVGELAPRFGVDAALTIDALRAGFRVIEVPCAMDHARTGRTAGGFAHRARQGLDLVLALVARAMRRPARRAGPAGRAA